MKNGNETEKYGVTTDQLDALFARNTAQSMAEREARQRAAAWPTEVEQLIATLARRSKAQADALGAIHNRLAVIEAAMGIKQG
jgi:hypothetical protein